jgi:ADP-heptose:LPS heptosyltransferase
MNVLILKLGATGDVVRTTPLLRKFDGHITWITAAKNLVFIEGLKPGVRCLPWESRDAARDRKYDLVISLEDELETAVFLRGVERNRLFGAYLDSDGTMRYTEDSSGWFDLSLISRFGREEADGLKLINRRTYQDLIFEGLGFQFQGEKYLLPAAVGTDLSGDVAIAADSGPVWPMKKWAYYGELKARLENEGLKVNFLPKRPTLLEHLADVRNHRCLVGGDSLPMHLALGSGVPCVSIFTCTSPWEIYEYELQIKILSPLLAEFFYSRSFDVRATQTISVDKVLRETMEQLKTERTQVIQIHK